MVISHVTFDHGLFVEELKKGLGFIRIWSL